MAFGECHTFFVPLDGHQLIDRSTMSRTRRRLRDIVPHSTPSAANLTLLSSS
ncbi:hypothetical protein [Fodinicola feengrottensis]|uniref:hypothetical protein n=1 Tax=Fodinicola feengrottensis TaxID=435914 RepID=UPI0013CFF59B|nr:hypothetical protein [Fodinicola feengrottensis]